MIKYNKTKKSIVIRGNEKNIIADINNIKICQKILSFFLEKKISTQITLAIA